MKILLGERLRDERDKQKLTIREVCIQTSISQGVLSDYENGKKEPGSAALAALADFYHISTDYLLGRTEVRTVDIDVQAIHNKIGLSENAIFFLKMAWDIKCNEDDSASGSFENIIKFLSAFVTDKPPDNINTMSNLAAACAGIAERTNDTYFDKSSLRGQYELGGLYWICQDSFNSFIKRFTQKHEGSVDTK